MTETEARKILVDIARQADFGADGAKLLMVADAIKVMERAIDIADKHAILAAEHKTLLECHRADHEAHEALKAEHASLKETLAAYEDAAIERGIAIERGMCE